MNKCLGAVIAALAILPVGLASGAQAASLWNESTDGDLSDLGDSPTLVRPLMAGSNLLKATFNAGAENPSPDYFTVQVAPGQVLKDIVLLDWQASPSFEDVAFMAVQKGRKFGFEVAAPGSRTADGLLGWTHLRSTQVGGNSVLGEMAVSDKPPAESGVAAAYNAEADSYSAALLQSDPELPARLKALSEQWVPGAEGFDGSLGEGEYTFWLRQGSDTNISVEMDFVTGAVKTPEPFSLLALGAVSGAGLLLKRRQARG